MAYSLDLTGVTKKKLFQMDARYSGVNPDGERLGFTNYYMEINGEPRFVVSGEFHSARMDDCYWEDEIIKMKMGGVNVIADYLFWIHHEEEEGQFCFTGCRDVRKFILLCRKHGMQVILRIGPYSHGETRNGGFPDWLYGAPFDMRKLSEGYLFYVRRYFTEVGKQLKGLFYRDGGPIIGCQIDNEYMHASSGWTAISSMTRDPVFGGDEGDLYMNTIRDLAVECGITPAFFTATAWGGAIAPDGMLPLWGGYAYRPWMLFRDGTHPCTDEFVYQDFHKNGAETTYDFHPRYEPESRPYGCCEIGGGMMTGYNYRIHFPGKCLDAIGNIKTASGTNLLGYYMFHGGSNPLGLHGTFMADGNLPRRSYDYQAPLGEFGQVRESYHRGKSLFLFARSFEKLLCPMKTERPEGAERILPEDTETLRYAVRTDGHRGFLFVNNFQDHLSLPDRVNELVELKLKERTVRFSFDMKGDENGIFPFNFPMDGIELLEAAAEPVLRLSGELPTYVFFTPEGTAAYFRFEEGAVNSENGSSSVYFEKESVRLFTVSKGEAKVKVLLLNRRLSNAMFPVSGERLLFCDEAVLEDQDGIRLETLRASDTVYTYPESFALNTENTAETASLYPGLRAFRVCCGEKKIGTELIPTAPHRYLLKLSDSSFEGVKDLRLQVDYEGDMAQAFVKFVMISDSVNNGDTWETGLLPEKGRLSEGIVLHILPWKKNARIIINDQMAAEREISDGEEEKIKAIRVAPVYRIPVYR